MHWRLVLLALLSLPLQAATLRFVGTDFPGILHSGTPQPYGLAVDVINAVCQREQLDCRIALLPWLRAQSAVQYGQADVLIGPYRNRERARFLQFSRYPLYVDTLYWYRLANRPLAWNGDFASLAGLRLGLTRGWTLGQGYESTKQQLDVDIGDTLEQGMAKLQRHRLDLIASNERTARAVLARLGQHNVLPLLPAISQQGGFFGYGLHTQGRDEPARFEQALSRLAESGELARLSLRHGLAYPGKNTNWPDYLSQLP
ncbi:transporter substrate-binding domain-containing protein [Vogesella sp. DC21W]|uniref:Transporter substrate-binding domain-containing protein n=1 Tax=Vogesella aquatica TaxID=2984206 RepID=A0ABT5IW17_9NEIS|nr:transporter substrate-binding domain-containing protein [Vogesella aquatica]MDC7716376.1 transporter substrate-binding domain-containing protein [Vogesella aquatica]